MPNTGIAGQGITGQGTSEQVMQHGRHRAPRRPLRQFPVGSGAATFRWAVRQFRVAPASFAWLLLVTVFSASAPAGWLRPQGLEPIAAVMPADLSSRPWSVVTSLLWAPGPASYAATVLALVAGVAIERRLGTRRYLASASVSHLAGVGAAAGFAWSVGGVMATWSSDLLSHSYFGATAAIVGAGMVASHGMSTLWRRRLRVGVVVLLLTLVMYRGGFADLVRLAAAACGLVLGPLVTRAGVRGSWFQASRREQRVLLAVTVAASAIGPVLAGLSPHAVGPLSVLRYLFTDIQPVDPATLQQLCTTPGQGKDCAEARLQLRAGAGGIFMAVLPCVLLLLLADGLRRGRRFAWGATLVVLGAMAALSASRIAALLLPGLVPGGQNESLGSMDLSRFHRPLSLVLPLLLPLLLLLLVAARRRLFLVAAPHGTYRRFAVRLVGTAACLAAIYLLGGSLLADGFSPSPNLLQLLADIPDRFLPLGYTVDVAPAFFPQTWQAVLLYEGTGTVFWTVAAALLLASFLRPAHGRHGTEDTVRRILHGSGGSNLSWMITWSGNSYWISPAHDSAVGFRVRGSVALALGPPIGPLTAQAQAIEDFTSYCNEAGWTPCFYSVPQATKDITSALGWRAIEVAQETVLNLSELTFKGKRFQDIRTALNKAGKAGIRAEWIRYSTAPAAVKRQITGISEEWVSDRKLPEMGFTLGGIDELADPEVRCLVALDAQQRVHAVTSWLPVHSGGRISGWTLDFMRRSGSGFNGSIEFLIANAALSLRAEGYAFLSLSGAPLARPASEAPGREAVLDRLLDLLGKSLEPVYGFRSLLAFKAKFGPTYQPLYLVYPDPAALPGIATALAQSYLPSATWRQRLALTRRLLSPASSTA
ncbi:MAG: hypothetical protein JWO93_548 [Micrococcaceae bacterium]|nr:hypothetical protein [Micrococcaceae bacterium]